ncbi:uncharacterized protein BCR38DRAFT_39431 [Pseudomassariella vexata]|uniref:Uncharacterized protein n=1 Tax=Pseudomassariella vexata TaxID=1141098 RepID=A0A1Y2DR63_9PEZI|nr:uncharacterized protein BCR38DRAFT_39431 [Pseudomassariella vexata]ORY61782.1 hypothetical protein BCR38DRAFT_39431 [Pseudomassariella vexata]
MEGMWVDTPANSDLTVRPGQVRFHAAQPWRLSMVELESWILRRVAGYHVEPSRRRLGYQVHISDGQTPGSCCGHRTSWSGGRQEMWLAEGAISRDVTAARGSWTLAWVGSSQRTLANLGLVFTPLTPLPPSRIRGISWSIIAMDWVKVGEKSKELDVVFNEMELEIKLESGMARGPGTCC